MSLNSALPVSLIIQVFPMRLLRRPFVRAQVEIAGRNKPVVAQDVLNMPDGAAIKKKGCRHSVAQHVRSHRLGKADHLSESPEPNERGVESEWFSTPANHKQRLALVLAPGYILLNPIERTRTEKEHPL